MVPGWNLIRDTIYRISGSDFIFLMEDITMCYKCTKTLINILLYNYFF